MAEAHAPLGEEDLVLPVPSMTEPGTTTPVSSESIVTIVSFVVTLVAALLARFVTGIDLLVPCGILVMAGLSYVEGSNSIGEGVATLIGGDVAGFRKALAWGALWSGLGCGTAFFLAAALLHTFTHDFFQTGTHPTEILGISVMIAVLLWMTLATRVGMPVSSNHATAGALVGAAIVALGVSHVRWGHLVDKVVIPIALSPIVAAVLGLLIYYGLSKVQSSISEAAMDRLHWLSSAASSFAKGLNQAPKIAAMGTFILLSAQRSGATPFWVFAIVGVLMALGSFLGGTRVTRTLAEDLTALDHTQALTANLTTALLVGAAANQGLPVSDAQVGSGAISGVGMSEGLRTINWSLIRSMILTWIITAPIAGLLGALLWVILYWLRHSSFHL